MQSRQNNLDPLRFWAALPVVWSHCFALTYGNMDREPLAALSGGQSNLGIVAVAIFFSISGYLITRSFDRAAHPWAFVQARLLRIMPALIVLLALLEFVLGPLASSLPWPDYLEQREPVRAFVLESLFLREVDFLPGLFEGNPLPHVDGSLWTLRYEMICYGLIFALGVTGQLTRYVILTLYVAAAGFIGVMENIYGLRGAFGEGTDLPGPDRLLDLGSTFLAGALIYRWNIPLRKHWAWGCLFVLIACIWLGNMRVAQRTVLPYLALYLGTATTLRLPSPSKLGDLSYGIYIYGWPVTQCVVMSMPSVGWFWTGSVATPITLVLAYLSWHGIERRALALKRVPKPAHADAQTSP